MKAIDTVVYRRMRAIARAAFGAAGVGDVTAGGDESAEITQSTLPVTVTVGHRQMSPRGVTSVMGDRRALTLLCDPLNGHRGGMTTTGSHPQKLKTSADRGPFSDTVVAVNGLTCTYGGRSPFAAVKNLTFSVQRGELYALLGTNGAGKTTTLETVEGHRSGSSGTVTVFGESPLDRAVVRPRVGIMLQESGFAADLTVLESVRLAGSLSGRQDDALRLVELLNLGSKKDTRMGQLSGGEKRRVDFCSAIWGSPELLFLDEPTTGLDPAARDRLWDVVADLRTAGATIILTTHYLEEAQKYADRIGLMHQGVLTREGTLQQLVADEASRISCIVPDGVTLPLPVAQVINQLSVIETHDLQGDLLLLLRWADDHGHTLERLSATSSTLDDVFRGLAATS
jgi:ABC-2 type transport system ATP-binding protein